MSSAPALRIFCAGTLPVGRDVRSLAVGMGAAVMSAPGTAVDRPLIGLEGDAAVSIVARPAASALAMLRMVAARLLARTACLLDV